MKSHALPYFFIGSIFAVLFVSGCTTQPIDTTTTTNQQTIQPDVKEFNVLIAHTYYAPPIFSVEKGDTVRFKVVAAPGTSTHMHGITIDEYGIDQAVTSEDPNNPVVMEFTADTVGEFKIYCKTCFTGPFGVNHPNIQATLIVQ